MKSRLLNFLKKLCPSEYVYGCTCTKETIRLKQEPNFKYCPYCGWKIIGWNEK